MNGKITWFVAVMVTGMLHVASVQAVVIGEGLTAVRCTEGSDVKLPKKLEFVQMVLSDHFATLGMVGLAVDVSYEDESVAKGKVIATAFLVKPEATEAKLAKLVAKIKTGEAEKLKIVDATIEPGDQVRWVVKLKGLPDLGSMPERCWDLTLTVFVADQIPG